MVFGISTVNLINALFIAAGIGVCGLCFLQILIAPIVAMVMRCICSLSSSGIRTSSTDGVPEATDANKELFGTEWNTGLQRNCRAVSKRDYTGSRMPYREKTK